MSDPGKAFFARFRQLWREGSGRGALTPRRRGHTDEVQWNNAEFCDALKKAGAAVSDEMIPRWREGRNVPRGPQMEAILKVFFARANESFDPDSPSCEAFRALWRRVTAQRQGGCGKPRVEPPRDNRPDDWWLEGGHEFPDLVTFRTYQPLPIESRNGHYEVPASLTFGTATPEDPDKGDIGMELSLTTAYLEIPVTSYQVSPDRPVCPRADTHVLRVTDGRYQITGPTAKDRLYGDTLNNETLATVEPGQRRGGPLALRITASLKGDDIMAVGKTAEGIALSEDKQKVLKLLLGKGCRRDPQGNRVKNRVTNC